MAIYIALLRGINVGGKNIIKMSDLKHTFESMGLNRVQTYIQSGNVLFQSDEKEEPLRTHIEHELETVFGYKAAVILRTAGELERIVENLPFSQEEILEAESSTEGESLYVALLGQVPLQERIERLDAYKNESEAYRIGGREVYLLFRHSIRNSKLAGNLHRLDEQATVRNWKTMNKLVQLARAMGT